MREYFIEGGEHFGLAHILTDERLNEELENHDPDKDVQEIGGLWGMALAEEARRRAQRELNQNPIDSKEVSFYLFCETEGYNFDDKGICEIKKDPEKLERVIQGFEFFTERRIQKEDSKKLYLPYITYKIGRIEYRESEPLEQIQEEMMFRKKYQKFLEKHPRSKRVELQTP